MASVLFSPITLRGLTLPNRVVVSPMCQYNSDNGSANDWHLMHLGNMSLGCGGLVMCEMTDVNPQGPDHAEMRRHVVGRQREGAQARARFLPAIRRRQARRAARPCRPQGPDHAAGRRRQADPDQGRRRLDAGSAVGASPTIPAGRCRTP